jgi:hypothetical protein
MICTSLYRAFFIKIYSDCYAEKILLVNITNFFGGGLPNDEDILSGIEEVYGSGEEVDGLADDPDYTGFRGKHKGIEIEVIVDGDGNVVTGYPTLGQEGVKENPKEEKE